MLATAQPIDRRHRRRAESVKEVLDVAVAVMADQGAAGLSLGEVARRLGIRPPSLYVYFASKNTLYDAIFTRGWRELLTALEPLQRQLEETRDLAAFFLEQAEVFLRWSVDHPAYSQLMFWRPVPNYVPSAEAYASSLEVVDLVRAGFVRLRERGLLRPDTNADGALRMWTMLATGMLTQQLANSPGQPFDAGDYTSRLPEMVAMFLGHYGRSAPARKPRRERNGNTH